MRISKINTFNFMSCKYLMFFHSILQFSVVYYAHLTVLLNYHIVCISSRNCSVKGQFIST